MPPNLTRVTCPSQIGHPKYCHIDCRLLPAPWSGVANPPMGPLAPWRLQRGLTSVSWFSTEGYEGSSNINSSQGGMGVELCASNWKCLLSNSSKRLTVKHRTHRHRPHHRLPGSLVSTYQVRSHLQCRPCDTWAHR